MLNGLARTNKQTRKQKTNRKARHSKWRASSGLLFIFSMIIFYSLLFVHHNQITSFVVQITQSKEKFVINHRVSAPDVQLATELWFLLLLSHQVIIRKLLTAVWRSKHNNIINHANKGEGGG